MSRSEAVSAENVRFTSPRKYTHLPCWPLDAFLWPRLRTMYIVAKGKYIVIGTPSSVGISPAKTGRSS